MYISNLPSQLKIWKLPLISDVLLRFWNCLENTALLSIHREESSRGPEETALFMFSMTVQEQPTKLCAMRLPFDLGTY